MKSTTPPAFVFIDDTDKIALASPFHGAEVWDTTLSAPFQEGHIKAYRFNGPNGTREAYKVSAFLVDTIEHYSIHVSEDENGAWLIVWAAAFSPNKIEAFLT